MSERPVSTAELVSDIQIIDNRGGTFLDDEVTSGHVELWMFLERHGDVHDEPGFYTLA